MVTVDMTKTGNTIKDIMNKQNIKVKDIQNLFGFNTPSCIYKWINGETLPTIDNLVILADFLNVGIEQIICINKNSDNNKITNTKVA